MRRDKLERVVTEKICGSWDCGLWRRIITHTSRKALDDVNIRVCILKKRTGLLWKYNL